jgi:L-alanine-DL-glutamate epimerase-like enolase superfamily enzyme
MKVVRIAVYQSELPFRDGSHTYHPVVVEVEADDGAIGWGEMCPLSESYDGAFAGWDKVFQTLAPVLLGEDPRNPIRLARLMDASVHGHTYPKSALDMACWDLAGKAFGVPLCELLGGEPGDSVEAFVPISLDDPDPGAYAATLVDEGYRSIQVKIGRIPARDAERIAAIRRVVGESIELVADANCAYSLADARRFL